MRQTENESTPAVVFDNVIYSYDGVKNALRGIDLDFESGDFIAILGGNGSGKSTLAKHINALFVPDAGRVIVAGLDTSDPDNIFLVREHAGMVFQNPDNQMVTSVVEEDIAFGPENLGLSPEEIRSRVDEALKTVAMQDYARSVPHNLSGGQKQRIAVAGILAMRPEIIVLDEPGAMLDPRGRRGVRRLMRELNEAGITIILITHFMEEAVLADRVVVLYEGHLVMSGTPDEVFSDEEKLRTYKLEVPFTIKFGNLLRERGIEIEKTISTEVLKGELCRLRSTM
ncbi:MAG: energy-coupling factor transporter ATPase [Actinobacteria bacterium]|nr:energy-coupling factor transporter ATPase [Actinomycetota bacterium]